MGWNKLMSVFQVQKGDSTLHVGVLRSSGVYKKKKDRKKGEQVTVAQLAAIHEFGTTDGRIPERSFMRSTIDSNKGQLESLMKKLVGKIADGAMSKDKALGVIGQWLADKMVAKIDSGVPPPNAQSTVDRKGSSQPLIDTGQLKNSIDWEIAKGKD